MASAWQEYQERTASFFRSLGLDARTDVRLEGVRTAHDVDVVVTSQHVGFTIMWLVECKHWQSAVSKLHVLGLRTIVADIGADRGILLSEAGFQSGAIEAAQLTNIHVTSLEQLQGAARKEIFGMRLRELYDRTEHCREQYWSTSKEERINRGLRADVGTWGYSGAQVIELLNDLFLRAFRGDYPITVESLLVLTTPGFKQPIATPDELVAVVEPLLVELEEKLRL